MCNIPFDQFSGGEQDDIAVALRITLSRSVAELHQVHEPTFPMFDEIFGSQDEEKRINLVSAFLHERSPASRKTPPHLPNRRYPEEISRARS